MVAFIFGLSVGLVLAGWQQLVLSQRLKQLLRFFGEENLPLYLSQTSRLFMAAAQQQRRQQELQSILSSVQQLINFAPIAYLQVDRDNHLLWCNQEASRLIKIDDPSPETPRLLLEQVRSYELDQLIESSREQQDIQQRQWVMHPLKADPMNPVTRQSLYLMGYAIPLPDKQVGVFLKNRQEVVQLTQQRDRWVSDVAHELKTPLTSIRLVAEMVETRVDPKLRPWVQRLLGEVIHLSNLVHDLLDLSRLERRAAQTLTLTSVNLPALIHKAWSSLEPITTSKQVQFSCVGPESLELEADQTRLYRVLLNLMDNAVKYSPRASAIQVRLSQRTGPAIGTQGLDDPNNASPNDKSSNSASRQSHPSANQLSQSPVLQPEQQSLKQQSKTQVEPSVHLEIIDTGPGFPDEDIDQVFERFYRADPARTRLNIGDASPSSPAVEPAAALPESQSDGNHDTSPSCGLGLAIVRQIVEAHSGRVTAKNHPETQGAWIQITLPLTPQQAGLIRKH